MNPDWENDKHWETRLNREMDELISKKKQSHGIKIKNITKKILIICWFSFLGARGSRDFGTPLPYIIIDFFETIFA
jgi:hypothetical protein